MIIFFHTIKIESDQGLSNSKNDILKVNQIHIKNKLNNMGLSWEAVTLLEIWKTFEDKNISFVYCQWCSDV